jgi:hypothetical protein
MKILFVLLLCLAPLAAPGAAFPHLEGQDLNGQPLALPDAAKGKVAVLVTGFSHASRKATRAWQDRILADSGSDTRLAIYGIANLEPVPGFIRGFVISSIRSKTPDERRPRFLVLLKNTGPLKPANAYDDSSPDAAYLIIMDASGEVKWQGHKDLDDASYAEFKGILRETADESASTKQAKPAL